MLSRMWTQMSSPLLWHAIDVFMAVKIQCMVFWQP